MTQHSRPRAWRRPVVILLGLLPLALSAGTVPSVAAQAATGSRALPGWQAASSPSRAPLQTPLHADERVLAPAGDLVVHRVHAVGQEGAPAYAAVADAPDRSDETWIALDRGAPWGRHRVRLTRAPSGNVVGASVRYRARAEQRPAHVRVRLYDGQRPVAIGRRHALDPGDGFIDLVDRFPGVAVSSASNLGVEVVLDGEGRSGGASYAWLSVRVRLDVSLTFGPTGLQGGAEMTSVAAAPGSATIVAGALTSGLYRSGDDGESFSARNAAMHLAYRLPIASVAFHPARPRVAYAITVPADGARALLRSDDDGRSWKAVSGITASWPGGPAPTLDRPPTLGTLLVIQHDGPRSRMWASGPDDALVLSRDGGASWSPAGHPGLSVAGLAQDPTRVDTLYVAGGASGTWVTSNARSASPAFRRLVGGPAVSEEVVVVGRSVYVAGGPEGLFRLSPDGRLEAANHGVPLDGSAWTSLAGYATGAGDVLFASCDPCRASPAGQVPSILRSLDGGTTWTPATGAGSVEDVVVGERVPWSLAGARPQLVPGDAGFTTHQLAAEAPGGDRGGLVLAAAPGGIWRSVDGGDHWAPAVRGLPSGGSFGLTGDPGDSDRVVQGSPGLGAVWTGDAFEHANVVPLDEEMLGSLADPVAYDAAFDPATQPPTTFVALSDADAAAGDVLVLEPGENAWRSTGFNDAARRLRPTSIAVGHDQEGQRILLATAHPGGGLWRKVGQAAWSPVAAEGVYVERRGARSADLAWVDGTTVVYLFDPAAGIFRSSDAGLTWQRVWAIRSNQAGGSGLAVGTDPDVVFVASVQGLHRLDGAASGSVEGGTVRLTQLGTFRRASDVALDGDGRLWVVSEIAAGTPSRLAVSWDPQSEDPTFKDLATRAFVETVIRPDSLHVTDDGTVLVADRVYGTFRGLPSLTRTVAWLPRDITLHRYSRREGPERPIEPVDEAVIQPLETPFVLHVASDGTDDADGLTVEHAVHTLGRAQAILQERFGAAAERLSSDVLILVHPGRYAGQSTTWTFTHPEHIVRIAGEGPSGSLKPVFVGCDEPDCASARTWFVLRSTGGQASNVQLVNLKIARYFRAILLDGGGDPDSEWNGSNAVHRCDFVNIGTRHFQDITPDIWSPSIISLQNSRANVISLNRFLHSSNRMDHANEWFHTIYASHGASDNQVQDNRIVDTSGDFHVRDGSDRNVFADNLVRDSFYFALVTDWGSEVETESCQTEISGNTWIGDWYCEFEKADFQRESAAPDGRCQLEGLDDYSAPLENRHRPARPSCVPG